jgi:alpha-beta hydrolase superfamily lysophospholipase
MFQPESFQFPSLTGEGIVHARLYRPEPVSRNLIRIKHSRFAEKPAAQPKQLVQIVHGMAEHSLRYDEFCCFLAGQGKAVCIHDHAGHGLTAVDPDRLGYFGCPGGWLNVLDDVSETRRQALSRLADNDNLPGQWQSILLGHSMGSFISRLYCSREGDQLAAAIFSGTSGANPAVYIGHALARRSVKKNGPLHKDEFLANLTGMGFQKRIKNPRTSADWLTRDQDIVDAYLADHLCGFTFSAAGYADLYRWIMEVSSRNWAGKVPSELPVLVFSGSEDPVGQYGRGPRQVCRWLKRNGNDVQLNLYAEGRHEMLNEINRQSVWQDITNWLNMLTVEKLNEGGSDERGDRHDHN